MKRRKVWPWLLLISILILLIGFGLFYFQQNYVLLEDTVYPRDTEALSFSSWPIEKATRLTRFTGLKQINVLQADITIEQYDAIVRLLPDCEILWLLPFQDDRLSLDTDSITLTYFTDEDIAALQYLPELKSVTVIDFGDAEDLANLQKNLPHCKILKQFNIGGTLLDHNSLYYSSTNINDIKRVVSMFPNVSLIDAKGCPFYGEIVKLREQYPKCRFLYEVPIGGVLWSERSTEIIVESTSAYELRLALPALPLVSSVEITQPIPDIELMTQLMLDYPDIEFTYCFNFFGKTLTPDTEKINISGVQLNNVAEFERYMPHFKNLKRAEMRRCGISNEDMDMLKQRYPDTFFVWEVQIGHAWIRTDVTYFMPYQHRLVLYDEHVDNMKYLTELICLDMGHMKVTRTDYLAYMPKLQYLLMCGTPITDISHCANMKDLKYVELFLTKVTDFSPLLECKNLVDLNICYTYPSDPLVFTKMTQLRNLWFRGMLDWDVQIQLYQALPYTRFAFDHGSSTGGGWRKLGNYYRQRDILRMPYMEED